MAEKEGFELFVIPERFRRLRHFGSLRLRQKSAVILIELPRFAFYAMMNADEAEGLSVPL